jgi:hypothetical protein
MASFLGPLANLLGYGSAASQRAPEPPLVPRQRMDGGPLAGDDGFVVVSKPGELGVTAAELEAKIIEIPRDGNCLYGSVRQFLKENWLIFELTTTHGGRSLHKLPSAATLRVWVADYIESKISELLAEAGHEQRAELPPLYQYLQETIHDHNQQIQADLRQQLDSMQALNGQKMSKTERSNLQTRFEKVQDEALQAQFEENEAGYRAYAKKVREDQHFHGGYAEVYALSEIFGFKIKVLTESTQEQLASGEDYSRAVSFFVEPTSDCVAPIPDVNEPHPICYLLFSPDARHFDLIGYTGS